MNWQNIQIMIFMSISIISVSLGAVFLKKGSKHFNIDFSKNGLLALSRNYSLITGILLYVFSTIFFVGALRLGKLSVIYPLSSLTYVFVSLISIYFLNEKMNWFKWSGIVLIILGVVLVAL